MFGFPKGTTVGKAHELLGTEGHCLVDVRSPGEVQERGIPGALNIPLEQLEQRLGELAEYPSIHVICRSGGRSGMGTNLLHARGLTQAVNVSGGIIAWEAAGLPTH